MNKYIYFHILLITLVSACTSPIKRLPQPYLPPELDDPIINKKLYKRTGCMKSPDKCMNRWGIFLYENEDCYEGYFKNGKKDGDGILYSPNKEALKGFWKQDQELGEDARTLGRALEMRYDPIKLEKNCKYFMEKEE
jgi:hypothetical protein